MMYFEWHRSWITVKTVKVGRKTGDLKKKISTSWGRGAGESWENEFPGEMQYVIQ